MTKETFFRRKEVVFLTIGLLWVALNFTPHTLPALESTVTNQPNNCTTLTEGESHVIAVPGSGSIMVSGVVLPDQVMQKRLDAAGKQYHDGEKIILLDGVSDLNSDDFNKRYLLSKFPNIPAEIVLSG